MTDSIADQTAIQQAHLSFESLKPYGAALYLLGERAIVIEIETEVSAISVTDDPKKPQSTLVQLQQQLNSQRQIDGILDIVLGMHNLTVVFEPLITPIQTLLQFLEEHYISISTAGSTKSFKTGNLIELKVIYGGELGPDLPFVAKHHQCTQETVIQRHSAESYLAYFMGFQPGFAYLHGLPSTLTTPRKTQPRTRIPAGSVAIAGNLTGVYPADSPGGWQIIGRLCTEQPALFDASRIPPAIISAGDQIKFVAVECQ